MFFIMSRDAIEKVKVHSDRCKGCYICVQVCPVRVIAVDKSKINKHGVHPVHIVDQQKCTSCTLCGVVCPDLVFEIYRFVKIPAS